MSCALALNIPITVPEAAKRDPRVVVDWERSPDNQPMASFPQVKLYAVDGRLLAAGSLADATLALVAREPGDHKAGASPDSEAEDPADPPLNTMMYYRLVHRAMGEWLNMVIV